MTAPSEREPREAQLDARLRRFARLRKAERALAPSVIELQQEPSKLRTEDFRRLLETVAELARTRSSDATFDSAMCDVDAALDEYAENLRRHADAASMAQLRATLPAIASQHREETLGLLDLWTEDEAGLPERVARVEYLVTLLSTREEDGVRRVVADPATLTPDFATLCTRIEQGFTGDLGDLELALHQAASELEQAPNPGEVARSLRERKEALGVHRLMPGVLRAIVSANLQLTNRMQARLREERDRDERFDDRFLVASSGTSTQADTEVGFASEPATGAVVVSAADAPAPHDAAGSILESEGLFVLREALRRRLRGASIGSCSSEMLVLRLDLSSLDEEERLACTRDADDPTSDDTLIALAVLLGTLLPGLAEYREALAELRIPEEALAEAWPRELNALLQARNSEHLLANRYEASCRLSETRTKFLFAPVTARAAAPNAADVELRHAADGAAATATRGAPGDDALAGTQRGTRPFRRPAIGPDTRPAAPRRRLALALAASLALTLGAFSFHHLTLTSGESVRDLSQRELSTLSGQLVAAYRSDAGTGSLLVGRVGIAWRGLDAEEQREEARTLSMRLARAGVAHVMIYDTDNRLVVDFAGGQLRVPAG